jgi:hypothetical protein
MEKQSCGLLHTMEEQASEQRGSLVEGNPSERHGCKRL